MIDIRIFGISLKIYILLHKWTPIGRPVNEPRMIEIWILGISLKIYILLHKWVPLRGVIQIDMTFNFIFRQGLPGTCLYKSIETHENCAEHHFVLFYDFYEDMFLEVPDEK